MNSLKIAMTNALLPSEEQSGVTYQVHGLAEALVRRGHAVTVFSFSDKVPGALYDVRRLHRAAGRTKFDPFFFGFELGKTDFSSFDIVHAHGDSFLLARCHPHVRTFHGAAADEAKAATNLKRKAFFRIVDMLERISAKLSDQNIGVSEATRRRFPQNISVIPCGVGLDSFYPGPKTQHPTILFVGTTDGRKRGAWLAESFAKSVRPVFPDAELLMVSDKPIDLPGVRNLGRVSDSRIGELYRSSWVFCLPSTYEGFGVPYIEAMASGTAVVATPNPGAREVLAGGAYGELPADAELGATLAHLLANSQRRDELVAAGLVRSRAYAWDYIAECYESVYRNAIAKTGKGLPENARFIQKSSIDKRVNG